MLKNLGDNSTLPSDFLFSVKYFFASLSFEIITFPGKAKVQVRGISSFDKNGFILSV